MPTLYQRLGLRPFINARGTITTLGGSIMPAPVVEAMAEASRQFVHLNELHEKAGARIAELTGAEAAFVSSGAAGGMLLAGAACLTGTDTRAIAQLPDVGDRPNQFVISLVDSHYYIHQGFRLSGGELVKVGTTEAVTIDDYVAGIGPQDRSRSVLPRQPAPVRTARARRRSPRAQRAGHRRCGRAIAAALQPDRPASYGLRSVRLQRRQGPVRAAVIGPDLGAQRPDCRVPPQLQPALGHRPRHEGRQRGNLRPAPRRRTVL